MVTIKWHNGGHKVRNGHEETSTTKSYRPQPATAKLTSTKWRRPLHAELTSMRHAWQRHRSSAEESSSDCGEDSKRK